jgi:hypothetical protein
MKFRTLIIVGFALGFAACAEKEQATPPAAVDEADTAAEAPVTEMPAAEIPAAEREEMGTADFVAHMHHHASQLDRLKAALEVESLAAAQRPAYWLAGHDGVSGIPDEWQEYVLGMRDAADAVANAANATDIETARAAAKRIEEGCAGCHTAAGVDIDIAQVE